MNELLVSALDCLLDGGEPLDGLDGAEDLLLADLHVVLDVSEDGRLKKVSLVSVSGTIKRD